MFFEYLKNREGFDHITVENGFAVYKKIDNILFVRDIYVKPNTNNNDFLVLVKKLFKIGKDLNCKSLQGQVYLNTINPTLSLKAILSSGFDLYHCDLNCITLTKEIK